MRTSSVFLAMSSFRDRRGERILFNYFIAFMGQQFGKNYCLAQGGYQQIEKNTKSSDWLVVQLL